LLPAADCGEYNEIMFRRMRHFLEMIRFSHTIFALPFALTSALLAWQGEKKFLVIDLIGILLCMVFARSAAMAFNRLADRNFDARNPRTAQRHIPAGKLSVLSVITFTIGASLGFLLSTMLFLFSTPPNRWPAYLAVPVLLFIFVYSFTKRITSLAHFWLGASLMLAPVAAWIAIRGMHQLAVPLVLGLAVFFWASGFDILYACQDYEFDQGEKLHSIPARIGVPNALRIALVCHVLMLGDLFFLWGICPQFGYVYLVGISLIAVLLAYEHSLVRPNDLTRVNRAFFHVNGVISVGLFAVVVAQLVVRW
jgi:4-hydroxybenzoate polyprenyltransferase